jgi:hypothetical protein
MGRMNVFLKSDTPEGKFDDIERVLQRMSMKLQKTVTVVVPPIPISIAMKKLPEDGEIFRGMFAADGKLTSIRAFIEGVSKGSTPQMKITIQQMNGLVGSSTYPLQAGTISVDTEIQIPQGSRVLMEVSEASSVSGLWLSALYSIYVEQTMKEQLSIDALTAQQSELIKS